MKKRLHLVCMLSCMFAVLFKRCKFFGFADQHELLFLALHGIFKTISATCFVYLCFANYKLTTYKSYGKLVLLGQILSWIGDVMLVFSYVNELYFMIGGASFLIGHIAYMSAFVLTLQQRLHNKKNDDHNTTGIYWGYIVSTTIVVSICAYIIGFRYILGSISPEKTEMRTLVISYTIMISIMASLSPAGERPWIGRVNAKFWSRVIGAFMFFLSDICVAREKFVVNDWINTVIGLPLYFGAQLFIANSV